MLDQESQKRYRTAMGTLLELRQRNGMDVRGNAGTLITEEMVTGKMAGLQKEIVERGDDFFDPAMKPVAEGLTKAETLEEMEKGASGVESLATGMQMGMDADLQPLLQELREAAGEIRTLGQMQESIKTREWGRFWQMNQQMHSIGVVMGNGEQHPNRWAEKIERQRMKLVRGAVAESAEFKELKVTAQEDVPLDKTLLEAADAAIKAEDYRRAVLVMEAYVTYSYGSGQVYGAGMMGMVPEGIRADIQGLQLFAEGKSFEAAGDMVSAVAAYRGVVRLTGQRVPLEQATARLTEIGKDNAELLKAPVVEGRAGVPGVR
jgi:hypothetical protein